MDLTALIIRSLLVVILYFSVSFCVYYLAATYLSFWVDALKEFDPAAGGNASQA